MSLSIFIQGLIWIHVILGSVALTAGTVVLVLRKGDARHKKIGKVFYVSMLLSALFSLVVAVLPNHQNIFLFCIGLFTIYLLIAGHRGLRLREKEVDLSVDKLLALGLGILGLFFIAFPILLYKQPNEITSGFGVVALYFALSDLRLFRRPKLLQERWLLVHLGKTIGAYLASVTAFFVVNNILQVPMWNWFAPGVFGGVCIAYYSNKVRKQQGLQKK